MRRLAACSILAALSVCAARSQAYVFQKIADSNTPRPDGTFFFRCVSPVIEQTTVILTATAIASGLKDSIWAIDVDGGVFHKVAGLDTAVPGGAGAFTEFGPGSLAFRNGTILFAGRDSSGIPFRSGIYTAGALSGPIQRVADYHTVNPADQKTFTAFPTDQAGWFALSGGQVLFSAANATQDSGIYTAGLSGSLPAAVATNIPSLRPAGASSALFFSPSIDGSTIAFCGKAAGDSRPGCSALYSVPLDDVRAHPDGPRSFTVLADAGTALPGNTNPFFETRFAVPGVEVDGGAVAFIASDVNSSYKGIFVIPAAGGAIRKIVATSDSLPGLQKLDSGGSFNEFAQRDGQIFFKAEDTDRNSALFTYAAGIIRKVIASGDKLNGQAVRFFGDPTPGAIGGGRVVFWASLIVSGPGQSDDIIAVAGPAPQTIRPQSVANAASYGVDAIAPGEIVYFTGTGIGPSTLTPFALGPGGGMPTLLGGSRILFDGVPAPLIYVSATQSAAVAPYFLDGKTTTRLTVEYQGSQSDPVTAPVVSASPGLFAADATGAGQGAILNQDLSPNSSGNPAVAGSVVTLFGTGGGQTDPPGTDGVISGNSLASLHLPVTVTIGSLPARVLYAGAAPGQISGVFQINTQVPDGIGPGNFPVLVNIGAVSSQTGLTLAVRP